MLPNVGLEEQQRLVDPRDKPEDDDRVQGETVALPSTCLHGSAVIQSYQLQPRDIASATHTESGAWQCRRTATTTEKTENTTPAVRQARPDQLESHNEHNQHKQRHASPPYSTFRSIVGDEHLHRHLFCAHQCFWCQHLCRLSRRSRVHLHVITDTAPARLNCVSPAGILQDQTAARSFRH